MLSFDDDELPPTNSSLSGPKPSRGERSVRLVAYRNNTAPQAENTQHVLLEVTDTSSAAERAGLDLVAVLDVSGSMAGDKLEGMKAAMKFVVGKLGPTDRLSIISFANTATVLRPLLCMPRDQDSQHELKKVVENGLKAHGRTNMEDGLLTGLKVLAGRRYRVGRVCSIILMSDGGQDPGDATRISIGDVAVYTFGFGADNDARVLETIASNSRGGTYYYVRDGEKLSEHFSQILAGLLSVAVQDLKLVVWERQGHSEISNVYAGDYHKDDTPATVGGDRSVTVSFGDLYGGEVRKVIVELALPAVHSGYRAPILVAQCRYSVRGKSFRSPRDYLSCFLRRTGTARLEAAAVKPEVKAELLHRDYTNKLGEASGAKDINSAKLKLEEAKKALDDAERQSGSSSTVVTRVIRVLRAELALLLSAAAWKDFLACLLASWTSHRRQRFAARGDVRSVRIFETQRMPGYIAQAQEFEENPNARVPTVEDDVKREEAKVARPRPRPSPPVTGHHHQEQPRILGPSPRERRGGWAWRAVIILCTVLAIALVVAGAAVLVVYLLFRPKTPYLAVSDARLVDLQYAQDGTIQYLQASITILAQNNNSKTDASFSRVNLALGFHGADVALLRAEPFAVPRRSSMPLRYNVVSAGQALGPAATQAMDEALKAGVVPLDLFGKARTRWKVGVFVKLKFWTRVSCRLRFFFPGNGTVMPSDAKRCRSRSP